MSTPQYQRGLHLFAILTVFVMLTTLIAGALVTSKNAGMAFRDWPTSDGQPMLSYPWWQDFAKDWDKFLEHGHRLAGVMIGCFAIGLVAFTHWKDERQSARLLSIAFLGAVIIQGLLGGFRVWLDARGLAMVHGAFACLVAVVMSSMVTILGRRWYDAARKDLSADVESVKPFAVVTMGVLVGQYILGGYVRHHGTALHEHLGLGILSTLVVIANTFVSHRSRVRWVGISGWMLMLALLAQVALGGATWISKWGFSPTGYVATADSIRQVSLRTAHMVTGILVIATAWIHLLRVLRVSNVSTVKRVHTDPRVSAGVEGGAA